MKIAFSAHTDDKYAFMLKVYLFSLVKNGLDKPFYIHCDECTLSWQNRRHLKKIYPGVIFRDIPIEKYAKFGCNRMKYYSVESFSLYGYDMVIKTEADVVNLKPIDSIYELTDVGIGMKHEINRPDMWSSGIIVIGGKYLNENIYHDLLNADYSYVKMFGNDMKLYNCYFVDAIEPIDYKYDVLISEAHLFGLENAINLHFIHKPGYDEINNSIIWPTHKVDQTCISVFMKYWDMMQVECPDGECE
jgi:hypothetical protein